MVALLVLLFSQENFSLGIIFYCAYLSRDCHFGYANFYKITTDLTRITTCLIKSIFNQIFPGSKSSEGGDSSSSSIQMPNDDREKQILEEIKTLIDGNNQSSQFTTLTARSIRVGSYKSFSKEKIVFIDKAIQITVPAIFERKLFSLKA